MAQEYKHEKVVIKEPKADGSVDITTESYYDKLAHRTLEVEKQLDTSRQDILKDIMVCLEPLLRQNSPRVVLTIDARDNEPYKITKRVTTVKESFGKR